VLHEYFLTEPDGKNIFDRNTPAGRNDFLRTLAMSDSRNINQDLEFAPAAAELSMPYKFVLLPSYAGFKVCIEVIPEKSGAGITVFWPRAAITNDTSFPVMLLKRNRNVEAYSNGRLATAMRETLYFSNEAYAGPKTYPFLSNPVPVLNAGVVYEQGELSEHAANDIRAFYQDSTNTTRWLRVSGSCSVNETDRVLVPLQFLYSLRTAGDVSGISVTLTDPRGIQVMQQTFARSSDGVIALTFPANVVQTVAQQVPQPNYTYTLTVTGSGGFSRTHRLLFYDGADYAQAWALVQIKATSSNADFNLLNADGSLRTQRQSNGVMNPSHPVFEIPVRSRITWWRYINASRLPLNNLHADYLDGSDGKLVSKAPRPMSYHPVFFLKPDNTPYFLPGPKPGEVVLLEDGRLFSNIYVSNVPDLFPLAP